MARARISRSVKQSYVGQTIRTFIKCSNATKTMRGLLDKWVAKRKPNKGTITSILYGRTDLFVCVKSAYPAEWKMRDDMYEHYKDLWC